MAEKKKIPCRVCGKLFEPCAYCQSHDDIFRWRNFACSRECAAKYMDDTNAYRESLKNKGKEEASTDKSDVDTANENIEKSVIEESVAEKKKTTRTRKSTKKTSLKNVDNELENKETE